MANYNTLKTALAAAIKQNGNNEITGPILQQALLAMVNSLGAGYQFVDVATPSTNPGTPDQNVFYIATDMGVYSNFDGASVPKGAICVFFYSGAWTHKFAYINFDGFVLNAKITDYPGYEIGRRLAIPYIYKNDPNYGSGVFVRWYSKDEENVSTISDHGERSWGRMTGEKSGVEVLTNTLITGGTIELVVDWDVIPNGWNNLLPTPVTLHNNLQEVVNALETSVVSLPNMQNVVYGGQLRNNNFGAINWFLPYGDSYTRTSETGHQTQRLTGKINGVFIGPIKPTTPGDKTYKIYKGSQDTPDPSGKTLIASGTITITDVSIFKEYYIEIPETELENEFLSVYYTGNCGILGRSRAETPNYTGGYTQQVYLKVGGAWYFGGGVYNCVPPRCVYGEEYPEYVGKLIDQKISEIQPETENVQINLPNKLYAVVGDTLQIFYRSIIEAIDPYIYDIRVVCNKGEGCPRYFSYRPVAGDVGTETFTVRLYNKSGTIVGEQSCQLVTVAAPASPSSVKKVFTFGDSLTSGGVWPNEAERRLVNTNAVDGIYGKGLNNIEFCGLFEVTRNEQTTKYFGVGGWTWASYTGAGRPAFRFQVSGVTNLNVGAVYSNNGHNYTIMEINVTGGTGNILCSVASATETPQASGTLTKVSGTGDATIAFSSYAADSQNPLWDYANNVMTFVPYVNQYGGGQCDVVYVLLSWNGQAAWKTYTLNDTTQISYAKTFARKLHSEYPNAKLKIVGIQMPSLNGGLAKNYGANSEYSDVYGLYKCAWSYNRTLQQLCNDVEFSGYCEFVDAAAQFDSENNMPENNNSRVNIRNSKTETIGLNGVHPADSGYYQIADAVYRNFVANFCQ